jgi:flagellar biosynthesis protein FlhG
MEGLSMDQAERLRQMVATIKNRREGARIVTVTSGKGGVGKSSFTLNFAIALSKKNYRVLVIDADFGLANIDLMSSVNPKYDLTAVLRRHKKLRDIIVEGPAGIGIVSGGSGVAELIQMNEFQLERIMGELMQLDDIADVILFDTGAGINDNILRLLRSSNDVILVTTPEPTAIMDAYALLKTVSATEHNCRIRVVVNKAETRQEANNTMQNLEKAASAYLGIRIENLGCIPRDPLATRAVKEQTPLLMAYPASPAAQSIGHIVRRFMELPAEPERAGVKRFFNLFMRAHD